ncbi:hypothetical protein [Nigerium massiliense]|uniref:hypothetical protein n=1 Tax=Nigerium massiliense TaxID=1522317 RepID=UPI00058B95F4|nr:hypothetical protein [Nigerium massiliense]
MTARPSHLAPRRASTKAAAAIPSRVAAKAAVTPARVAARDDDERPSPRFVAVWVIAATILHVACQSWAILATSGAPLTHFRTFASGDQLGYLAISANVLDGQSPRVEPYTETGTNTYPPLYYTLIGLVAKLLHLAPATAWNATGVAIQATMAAVLALTLVRLSGRAWCALLAPAAFLTGTFSWLVGPDWFTHFDAHATLWGPYGVLTALNAESAGLALGIIGLCLLARAFLLDRPQRRQRALTLGAAVLVGVIANFQTYSFLTFVYVVGAMVSTYALVRGHHVVSGIMSAFLLLALYLAGPLLAQRIGQFPLLVVGLVPFLPGIFWVLRRYAGTAVLTGLVCAAAAAPQILMTLHDLQARDPFLTYRVASSKNLGVTHPWTLVSMAPVALPLIGVAVVSLRRHSPLLAAGALGTLVAWPFGATNDVWGANAEPYRFWIDGFCIGAVVVALSLAGLAGRRGAAPLAPVEATGNPQDADAGDRASVATDAATPTRAEEGADAADHGATRRFPSGRVVALCAAALFALTLPDYVRWAIDPRTTTTWDPANSRSQAITALARTAIDGSGKLLLTDRCINPQYAKVTSGAPIAYYRLGMAWPADPAGISGALQERNGSLSVGTIRRADIRYVLVDSACGTGWMGRVAQRAHLVARENYTPDLDAVEGAAPLSAINIGQVTRTPAFIALYRLDV